MAAAAGKSGVEETVTVAGQSSVEAAAATVAGQTGVESTAVEETVAGQS